MNTNTAEIKNYLHKLIVETDDEGILSKVQAYFTTLQRKNIDWWDTISDQEKEAESFEARVESLINRLKTQKRLCPPSGKQKNLRRCVIAPQTSLVYQIKDNIIELVAFFDNRSEHKY